MNGKDEKKGLTAIVFLFTLFLMFGMIRQTTLDVKVGDTFSSDERYNANESYHPQDDNDANPERVVQQIKARFVWRVRD